MRRRQYFSALCTTGLTATLSGCYRPQFEPALIESEDECNGEKPCPSISQNPSNPVVGEQVVFDASGSQSPTDDTLTYFWTDPEHNYFFTEGPTYQRRFDDSGRHSVVVWVTPADNVREADTELGFGPNRPDLVSRANTTVNVQELSEEPIDLDSTDVNIHFRGSEQGVSIDDTARLSLSATNLVGNDTLTIQLLIEVPSGLTVNGTSFAQGGGQYTSSFTLDAGETISESVTVQATEAGAYSISGYIVYYFEEDDRQQTQSSNIELRFFE